MESNTIKLKISTNDLDAIAILENLLIDEGFTVHTNDEIQVDNMGIDPTILTIVIPAVTAAITGLTTVLKIVAQNQNIEYELSTPNSTKII